MDKKEKAYLMQSLNLMVAPAASHRGEAKAAFDAVKQRAIENPTDTRLKAYVSKLEGN